MRGRRPLATGVVLAVGAIVVASATSGPVGVASPAPPTGLPASLPAAFGLLRTPPTPGAAATRGVIALAHAHGGDWALDAGAARSVHGKLGGAQVSVVPGQGRICLMVETATSASFDCSTAEGAATGHLYMTLGNGPGSTTPTAIYGLAPDTAPTVSVTQADGSITDLPSDHGVYYGMAASPPTSISMRGKSSYTLPLAGP